MNFLRTFLRFFLLPFHRSKVPTGLMPLARISSAAVLRVEGDSALDDEINAFFGKRGIKPHLLSRKDRDLRTAEELFISLLPERCMDETYAVVCSTAVFKVGIHDVRNCFDLTVRPKEGEKTAQAAVFQAITDILQKIR